VAAILAGSVTLPVEVVNNLAKKVTWTALEDMGVVSKPTSTRRTLPQPGSIPRELYKFEGIYGGHGETPTLAPLFCNRHLASHWKTGVNGCGGIIFKLPKIMLINNQNHF
jgi:hypothetical protein